MTRELKLALIVGFALVLVVTVLISDHMSRARTTRLADSRADQPFSMREITPAGGPTNADRVPTPTGPLVTNAPTTVSDVTSVAHEGMGAVTTQPPTLVLGAGGGMNTPPGTSTLEQMAINSGYRFTAVPPAIDTGMVPQSSPNPETLNQVPAGSVASGGMPGEAMPGGEQATSIRLGSQPPSQAPAGVEEPVPGPGNISGNGGGIITGPLTPKHLAGGAPKADDAAVYTVVSGDSLYKIAAKQLGNAEAWRQIAKANGLSENTSLKIGQKLRMPVVASRTQPQTPPQPMPQPRSTVRPVAERAETSFAAQAPRSSTRPVLENAPTRRGEARPEPKSDGKTYVVRPGDTIMTIAQKALGSARRAEDILAINDDVDSDNIHVGQVLKLPPR